MKFLRMQNKLLMHVDLALGCSVKVAVQIGKLEEVSKLFTFIIIFFW